MADIRFTTVHGIVNAAEDADLQVGGIVAIVDQATELDIQVGGIYLLADQANLVQTSVGGIFLVVDAELAGDSPEPIAIAFSVPEVSTSYLIPEQPVAIAFTAMAPASVTVWREDAPSPLLIEFTATSPASAVGVVEFEDTPDPLLIEFDIPAVAVTYRMRARRNVRRPPPVLIEFTIPEPQYTIEVLRSVDVVPLQAIFLPEPLEIAWDVPATRLISPLLIEFTVPDLASLTMQVAFEVDPLLIEFDIPDPEVGNTIEVEVLSEIGVDPLLIEFYAVEDVIAQGLAIDPLVIVFTVKRPWIETEPAGGGGNPSEGFPPLLIPRSRFK